MNPNWVTPEQALQTYWFLTPHGFVMQIIYPKPADPTQPRFRFANGEYVPVLP